MAQYRLSRRQQQPLSRWIHRFVVRQLQNVEALEVLPHWMGGIREAPGSEGIRRQQVGELDVHTRFGNRQTRQLGDTHQQYQQPAQRRGEGPSLCDSGNESDGLQTAQTYKVARAWLNPCPGCIG